MLDVARILELHRDMVIRWHRQSLDNPYDGVWSIVCKQHGYNFLLWHEEDIARSRDVSDGRIAEVKRAIDRYNQQRNDWIEKIDDWLSTQIHERQVTPRSDAPLNTETPGSAIDRLSILSLRIYHLQEQLERPEIDNDLRDSIAHKLAVCSVQRADLSQALVELLQAITTGEKRHRTYRQFKMYNDPALNPYLYTSRRRAG